MIRSILLLIIALGFLGTIGVINLPGWVVSGMVAFSTVALIRAVSHRDGV